VYTESLTASANGTYTTTTGYAAIAAGTYEWMASFSGDGNNTATATTCGNEPVTITAQPTITSTAMPTGGPLGTQLQDSATMSGTSNLLGTGTITFKLYGAGNTTCTGTPVDTETVTKIASNGPFGTTSGYVANIAGTYQWVASFGGDGNNTATATTCGNEPVVVAKATPTVTTQAAPTAGTVGVKITAGDTATLSGGASPSGTVTFSLYANSSCMGTPVITGTATISGTTASYGASWTPAAPSTYDWQATYNGDSNNSAVPTACGGSTEQVVIAQARTTVTTQASPTTGTVGVKITAGDTATLSGGASPTGTVTFKLYATSTCTGTPLLSGNGTIKGTTASYSVKWTPAVAGTYYWIASYLGDANNAPAAGTCRSETVVITAQSTISTTANPKSAGVGTTLQDGATLANTSNLLRTGSITFKLFGPGDTTCATVLHTETVTGVKTNGPFSTTTGFVAKTIGTYEWTATFTGDANNTGASSGCRAEPVSVGPQVSEITPSATTCAQFASGFATRLTAMQYTLNGTKISTVTPPTFTYWVKVIAGGTFTITQSTSETSKKLLLASGSAVYDNATASNCSTVTSTITQKSTSGAVTVKFSSGTGPFYIGLNFSTSKMVGETAPAPSTTVQYIFNAGLTGASSEVDLKFV
jgi:hypothetical protein